MSVLDVAMESFPYVFHPITVLGAGIILLIHHEWSRQDVGRSVLWHRLAAFLGTGVLALVPTVAFFAITGASPIAATQGNSWQMDALVASGLFIAACVLWVLWHHFEWGLLVPGMMEALAGVTVPYVALSPVWNVSGHVIVALMPTLYLTLVDRKFWPTLAIPLLMIPNRLYLQAHTVAQTVGAFFLALAIVLGLYWYQTGGSLRPEPESATP